MPPPKSPLDRPSSSHSRRPGPSRRTSSEKSTKLSKNGVNPGISSQSKSKDSMTDATSGAKAPSKPPTARRDLARVHDLGTTDVLEPKSPTVSGGTGTMRSDEGDIVKGNRGSEESAEPNEIIRGSAADEVERLRLAMDAQLQLSQQREKLARQLLGREGRDDAPADNGVGRSRVSPINEEKASPSLEEAFASPIPTALDTASTESARTIRGGITPAVSYPRTPSYPFPSMKPARQLSWGAHRPFTALSPTVNPTNFANGSFHGVSRDHVLSGSVTPASTLNFQPPNAAESHVDPNFETPNLYDLSLMLTSEPGLDAWWTTVVQLMRELYKAERVNLSVPADSTDIENVPWGQKATFNAVEEDELSLAYLQRGSSLVPSSGDTNDTSTSEEPNTDEVRLTSLPAQSAVRPGLLSRHSFTSYEETKKGSLSTSESAQNVVPRPTPLTRAKSYFSTGSGVSHRPGTLQPAGLNLQTIRDHITAENTKTSISWENAETETREVQGRVFPVLQALDFEVDPLIDSGGILRVLERGRVIALTRDYPYMDEEPRDETSGGSSKSSKNKETSTDKPKKGKSPDMDTRFSNLLGNSRRSSRSTRGIASEKGKILPASTPRHSHEDQTPLTPRYEEYEQAPASPWAQSPAPSPAVRTETAENPFFSKAPVDEETFNPKATPQDYSQMPPVEAIGVDTSWTVLHIPLIHPLLSKSVQSFRLDAAAMELKTARTKTTNTSRRHSETGQQQGTDAAVEKRTPIAIISILSPLIPYPSNLRHSLSHLAPHLATSFSLCRHYSNLETEIAGLSRKRPQTAGFGAVAPGGRPVPDRNTVASFSYSPMEHSGPQRSTGGSITSPSDYSGVSRSTAGSPYDTLGWDPSSIGFSRDKWSSGGSPSYSNAGEGYFISRARPNAGRARTGSASSNTNTRLTSTQSPTVEGRSQQLDQTEERVFDTDDSDKDQSDESWKSSTEQAEALSSTSTPKQVPRSRPERLSKDINTVMVEARDVSPSRRQQDAFSPRRQAMRTASNQGATKVEKQHTQLHSYGADYGATFQSLPTTNVPSAKNAPTIKGHGRSGSVSMPADAPQHMLPPSDRLKGLMLDSLPAHVFVALPATGEIVWVNNRYLTYRGQTVPELYQDPWGSIHPEERDEYFKSWSHAVRTGEQFSMQIRIRRFDGTYRWFYTRAVGHRDIRGVIVQWYGSHMDIHDQHIAEVKAARQEEIEASEAKHRQLANLIPQIIFAATEDEGVTFANEQWLSYTGQDFESSLGLGFMNFVHPDDLAKCHIPTGIASPAQATQANKPSEPNRNPSQASSGGQSSNKSSSKSSTVSETPTEVTVKDIHETISRNNSSSGSSFYDLPTSDLSELAKNGVIKASTDSNGRISYTTEVRLRSKTGEYRWHLVRCVEVDNISLGSGDGSWFGACTDINDHKLLETKLKEAMDSKTRFLSNMSHEIRTPLIGISGMVNFLQDTTLNDEQIDYANTIHASAKSLLNIINDILDLSKVDAGMMKLSYDWFHPRSLVEEVNEMVCTMAITKRLELNYVVDNDVPEMVKGDKFRIRQVLLNVIGNAIKFTNTGEVFSRCKVMSSSTEGGSDDEIMLEFSVIDSGRGFTAEEAEMIFKPFSQIDGSSTRQVGGSGLGLVISRNLVELHGGHMAGSAIPGKGSTFVFSARFGLPTAGDHPDPPMTPHTGRVASLHESDVSEENVALAMKQAGGNPILANKFMQTPLESPKSPTATSPTVLSSSGSEPSLRSTYSHGTQRSSGSSIAQNLAHFGEAARATASDLPQMKLALPDKLSSPTRSSVFTQAPTKPPPIPIPTASFPYVSDQVHKGSVTPSDAKRFQPPMYSILLICPQTHSREATTQHIENTLPKDVPHKIVPIASVPEAHKLISGDEPVIFTHIVLNLTEAEDIVALVERINTSNMLSHAFIVVLSDPVQRQEVVKISAAYHYDQLVNDSRITFIYKPVKPSRFAVVFDPDKERDLSLDRNRFNAQQQVASQKQNYLDVAKRLGNKGHKVLLVEDNLINQKVLIKYLGKIGVSVDLALDGVECIEKVFARPHSFYSLILCDLHMPRKDGYETCREIRLWEKKEHHAPMPIIALSANVMAEVVDKCVQAGFSNYITKPIDFKSLSTAMGEYLDPIQHQPHTPALEL